MLKCLVLKKLAYQLLHCQSIWLIKPSQVYDYSRFKSTFISNLKAHLDNLRILSAKSHQFVHHLKTLKVYELFFNLHIPQDFFHPSKIFNRFSLNIGVAYLSTFQIELIFEKDYLSFVRLFCSNHKPSRVGEVYPQLVFTNLHILINKE